MVDKNNGGIVAPYSSGVAAGCNLWDILVRIPIQTWDNDERRSKKEWAERDSNP